MSPVNLLLVQALGRLGSIALYLPVVAEAGGLLLARFATGRWAWATLIGVLGALPLLAFIGRPEAGESAPVLLLGELAISCLSGVFALTSDPRSRLRWISVLPFLGIAGVLLVLGA
jgi:hypothetical protein